MHKTNRQSNFELMRIFSMFLIVLSHVNLHGVLLDQDKIHLLSSFAEFPAAITLAQIFNFYGKVGVDLFILLTGFFMINKSSVTIKKLVYIWLQVIFYSLFGFIIFTFFSNENFSFFNFFNSLFPILTNNYWFITTYFLLYLTIPILNKSWNSISDSKKIYLFFVLFFVYILLPTAGIHLDKSSNLIRFIIIYLFGAFLRDRDKRRQDKKLGYFLVLFSFILELLAVLLFEYLGVLLKNSSIFMISAKFSTDTFVNFSSAVGLFLIFQRISLNSKYINKVAPYILGVYLLHDNVLLRKLLWRKWIQPVKFLTSGFLSFIFFDLLCAIVVFVVSLFIEFLRKKLLDNFNNKTALYVTKKIELFFRLILDYIKKWDFIKKCS